MIPVTRGKPTKLKVMVSNETPSPEFKDRYDQDPLVRRWLDMAIRIEGTNKTFGVHAAGVVISSESLDEIVPLQKNNDGAVITQYYMEDLESLGLLKMDFLGLRNLTTIQRAADLIEKNRNIKLDVEQLPTDERKALKELEQGKISKLPTDIEKTHKLLGDGELEGIFQLESSGMKQIVKDLKPSGIEDISSILALYRPGPLDAGLIPKFINRKHGKEAIKYEDKLLEPILKETYAVLVYQEQIMTMAQQLAGYSLGEADLLRRAMGKKKASEMEKHQKKFIDGSLNNGVSRSVAENLFQQMVNFAEYCLSYDTKVLTVEYGLLPIGRIVQENIKCKVYTINNQGVIYTQPIAQWHDRGKQEIFEYCLDDETVIQATKDHKFMTTDNVMMPIDQIFEEGLELKKIKL